MTLKALLNDQPGARERKKIKDGELRTTSPVEQTDSPVKDKTASTNQPEMAEEMTRTDQIASPKRVDGSQTSPRPRMGADSFGNEKIASQMQSEMTSNEMPD